MVCGGDGCSGRVRLARDGEGKTGGASLLGGTLGVTTCIPLWTCLDRIRHNSHRLRGSVWRRQRKTRQQKAEGSWRAGGLFNTFLSAQGRPRQLGNCGAEFSCHRDDLYLGELEVRHSRNPVLRGRRGTRFIQEPPTRAQRSGASSGSGSCLSREREGVSRGAAG